MRRLSSFSALTSLLLGSVTLPAAAQTAPLPDAPSSPLPAAPQHFSPIRQTATTLSTSTPPVEQISVTATRRPVTQAADTAALFRDVPGFSSYRTGGIASLPVLNGMADDRVATFVDGMPLMSDCPNHMNPALSQISLDEVSHSVAIAGITPVSLGGDSTGGTISVERKDPQFAREGKILVTGDGREDWRSNGGGSGAGGSITVANDMLSLRYSGSYTHASDYTAGGRGGRVLSSSYLSFNHDVTAGLKLKNHLFSLTFGQQDTPYEGFPNQYMDETNNRSTFVNGKYTGTFSWGTLEARGYWQRVTHAMNMLADKGGHSATTGMPMNSDGRTAGYSLVATIPLGRSHQLKIGSSFSHDGLNDWWPPVMGSMMMGPGTFHSLNGAHRDHLGHFIQWNAQWTPRLSSELGMRSDVIMMNTGPVSPYQGLSSISDMGMGGMSMTGMGGMSMDSANQAAARAFNSARRGRTDDNFDVTALLRYRASAYLNIEGGYARKTRSPNLYERYGWSRDSMTARMINWFGDGNGYVGNLNLKPEVANTASVTFRFHDADDHQWEAMIQPFYTYTHNYINVVRIDALSRGFSLLQFANHNAQSYGINASGRTTLWDNTHWGTGELSANLNWVRGQDFKTHSGLYQQIPLNGTIRLHEHFGPWHGMAEVVLVKAKHTVDWVRNEPRTPGYALFNLGAGYHWSRYLQLDVSLDNLLNQRYALPLGGRAVSTAGNPPGPVLGVGRSVNLTLREHF
ncbi:TonB-dependent receptor [Bombella sp. TMW 2.2559]|uniref:TonB-dependent receptor n=1 Tax=Bombella dulcis TaxID=2967339 RepID=A0ABT3WBS3_9PROT|nr:TonB-dependent receptor [Bombella dulcis]MCX5616535.1 TonB-dependent receptor [Bombella dulcis]